MPPDYSKSSIYRIDCDVDGLVYVGSTVQTLAKRWGYHVSKARNEKNQCKLYQHMRLYGNEHFHITLIEAVSVKNRAELEAIEGKHQREMDVYKNGLNCRIEGRSKAEYYADPEIKAKITEYRREYYADPENKAKLIEGKRKYRTDPEIKAKQAEYIRQYYANPENKAKLAEQQRQYRARKKAEKAAVNVNGGP